MAYQTIHGRRVRVASPKTVVQVSIHVPVAIGEQPCRGEHERFVLVRFSSGLSTSLCAAWPMVSAQRCSAIYTPLLTYHPALTLKSVTGGAQISCRAYAQFGTSPGLPSVHADREHSDLQQHDLFFSESVWLHMKGSEVRQRELAGLG